MPGRCIAGGTSTGAASRATGSDRSKRCATGRPLAAGHPPTAGRAPSRDAGVRSRRRSRSPPAAPVDARRSSRMQLLPRSLLERLGQLGALDPVGKALGKAVDGAVKPGALKDFLAGTWLGHPLHPVLTDLPIGFWSSSFALDVFGGKDGERASEILLGLGVLSALPTAAAGLTDWTDTGGAARRIGLLHAIGNLATMTLFTASLVERRRGHRGRGIALSTLGVAGQSASAYLGGHLSFGKGIGVDNTAFDREPRRWTPVLDAAVLSEGKPMRAETGGADVLLYRDGNKLFA